MSRSSRRDRWRAKRESQERERPDGAVGSAPEESGAQSGEEETVDDEPVLPPPPADSSGDETSPPVEMSGADTPVAAPLEPTAPPPLPLASAGAAVAAHSPSRVSLHRPSMDGPPSHIAIPHRTPPLKRPVSASAGCYVDFENLFYSAVQQRQALSVARVVRLLNRLGREITGVGWSMTAVYANWDAIVTHHRHAQDDWGMLGWRTVAVPAKEDYLSQRPVKNLVDFVMSLDILEDARDRGWEHFCIVTGDADFCEVAERLKRLRRRVTVVALKPNLSFRLREAADEYFVWGFNDITGDDPLPNTSYRRLTQAGSQKGKAQGEDPYQVLMRAVRNAEKDQGVTPVSWGLIRDEYFLRMTSMAEAEAERFVRELHQGGFVNLVTRRGANGGRQVFLSIPR